MEGSPWLASLAAGPDQSVAQPPSYPCHHGGPRLGGTLGQALRELWGSL